MSCKWYENCLRTCFILALLNGPTYRVARPYIWSTIFVSRYLQLHSNRILIHGIVAILLLIEKIWWLHITQKNLAFILHMALHWITVLKCHHTLEFHVFRNQLQMKLQTVIPFPSTILMLHVSASKQCPLPLEPHPFNPDYLTQFGRLFVIIKNVYLTFRYNPYRTLLRAVDNREIDLIPSSAKLEIVLPRLCADSSWQWSEIIPLS